MLKKLTVIFVIIILLLFFFLIKITNTKSLSQINFNKLNFIAHAGGGYKNEIYLNSKESITKSIERGYKLIELDLLETADGLIVAAHDWESLKKNCILYNEALNHKPLEFKKFTKCNLQKNSTNFTQLSEEDINEIFFKFQDLFLVTDKINNYKLLADKFNFIDRIFPETFSLYDYLLAKYYGFQNPIFPYKKYNSFFGKLFNIKLINVSYSDYIKDKNKISKLYDKGLNIYVYTTNDESFINKNINKNITGVYSDFWDINLNKCLSNNKCISY